MCIDVDKVIKLLHMVAVDLSDIRISVREMQSNVAIEKNIERLEKHWDELQEAMRGIICFDRDALVHSVLPTKPTEYTA